jgi:hypothetical protein
MNNIVRNENDPMVDGIDVAPTAPHSLSFSLGRKTYQTDHRYNQCAGRYWPRNSVILFFLHELISILFFIRLGAVISELGLLLGFSFSS